MDLIRRWWVRRRLRRHRWKMSGEAARAEKDYNRKLEITAEVQAHRRAVEAQGQSWDAYLVELEEAPWNPVRDQIKRFRESITSFVQLVVDLGKMGGSLIGAGVVGVGLGIGFLFFKFILFFLAVIRFFFPSLGASRVKEKK